MFYLEKTIVISAAHFLSRYEGICKRLHGHNWVVTVYCKGGKLDRIGMLIDFKRIKEMVGLLDHQNLNKIVDFNPTAENLAKYLCDSIPYCYKTRVVEQEGSICEYIKD